MERKEESGRWGSMSISPYMSVIKTTKRLVIRFYPGRIFLIYFNLIPFQNVNIIGLRSCMLLDQNQNNQLHCMTLIGILDGFWKNFLVI